MGYKSRRADSVHVTQHRLSVAGFSLRRQLVSNIFRAHNSCLHQIRNGPLIGSLAFSYSSSSLSIPCPAGLKSFDLDSTKKVFFISKTDSINQTSAVGTGYDK
jgi:hypothetical protein